MTADGYRLRVARNETVVVVMCPVKIPGNTELCILRSCH